MMVQPLILNALGVIYLKKDHLLILFVGTRELNNNDIGSVVLDIILHLMAHLLALNALGDLFLKKLHLFALFIQLV